MTDSKFNYILYLAYFRGDALQECLVGDINEQNLHKFIPPTQMAQIIRSIGLF